MKRITTTIAISASAALLCMVSVSFAEAQDLGVSAAIHGAASSSSSSGVRAAVLSSLFTKAKDRGDQEIDRRTTSLNALIGRISEMKRVSTDEQTTLTTNIQDQITALAALKTKIDADNSTSSLRADIKSITDSYRIYMLVMPESAILAAVDRITTIVNDMDVIGTKLQTRIAAASTSTDVSAAQTALADYDTKVADAQVQANAAENEVANLQPDNGDATIAQSNMAALKNARGKIQAAQKDLIAARKDIDTILKNLPKISASASVSASSTSQ